EVKLVPLSTLSNTPPRCWPRLPINPKAAQTRFGLLGSTSTSLTLYEESGVCRVQAPPGSLRYRPLVVARKNVPSPPPADEWAIFITAFGAGELRPKSNQLTPLSVD